MSNIASRQKKKTRGFLGNERSLLGFLSIHFVNSMGMDIISPPYIKGFEHGNHKINENRCKTVFFLAFCLICMETYTQLIANDLLRPCPRGCDISSVDFSGLPSQGGTVTFPDK